LTGKSSKSQCIDLTISDSCYNIVCKTKSFILIIKSEEWIVVIPSSWREKNKRLNFEDLFKKPFIRHAQVNPDFFGLNSSEISHMTSIIVDNLIAVRSGVSKGLGRSVVPRILVDDLIKEKKLISIPHPIEMDRKLCLWWHRSRSEPKKKAAMISSWLVENFERM
jgi:DNA-binding transcriptional LysR family regulator